MNEYVFFTLLLPCFLPLLSSTELQSPINGVILPSQGMVSHSGIRAIVLGVVPAPATAAPSSSSAPRSNRPTAIVVDLLLSLQLRADDGREELDLDGDSRRLQPPDPWPDLDPPWQDSAIGALSGGRNLFRTLADEIKETLEGSAVAVDPDTAPTDFIVTGSWGRQGLQRGRQILQAQPPLVRQAHQLHRHPFLRRDPADPRRQLPPQETHEPPPPRKSVLKKISPPQPNPRSLHSPSPALPPNLPSPSTASYQLPVFNFVAGPATLPESVLLRAQAELFDFRSSDMSIMEMSHCGKEFDSVIKKAESDLRRLLSIPNDYSVLFLQGGATAQFAALPLNHCSSTTASDASTKTCNHLHRGHKGDPQPFILEWEGGTSV